MPSLGVLFENGKVTLPNKTRSDREALEPMVAELWGLGRERHDDTVMALWIAETVLRKSAFNYVISFSDDDSDNLTALPTGTGDEADPLRDSMNRIWDSMPWYMGGDK